MDYMHFQSPYTTANRVKRMLWRICWTLLARPFPKSTFMPWKRCLLRLFGAKVADTANVYASASVFMPWNLVMKDHACLASGVDCYNAALIELGVNATVSQRAFLCTASHDITSPCHEQIERPIQRSCGRRTGCCIQGCGTVDGGRGKSGAVHQKAGYMF